MTQLPLYGPESDSDGFYPLPGTRRPAERETGIRLSDLHKQTDLSLSPSVGLRGVCSTT